MFSKIILQWSLHPLRFPRLRGTETFFTIKEVIFSKTYPSFLTVKEGSTFLTKPLFPQEREDVTALSAVLAPPVPPQREGPYPIPKP